MECRHAILKRWYPKGCTGANPVSATYGPVAKLATAADSRSAVPRELGGSSPLRATFRLSVGMVYKVDLKSTGRYAHAGSSPASGTWEVFNSDTSHL